MPRWLLEVAAIMRVLSAGSGIRTRTPFRADAFETSMSAVPSPRHDLRYVSSTSYLDPPADSMRTIYRITVGSWGESEPTACRDRRRRSPDPSRPQGDARGRGLLGRGRGRRRGVRRRAGGRVAPGSGHP